MRAVTLVLLITQFALGCNSEETTSGWNVLPDDKADDEFYDGRIYALLGGQGDGNLGVLVFRQNTGVAVFLGEQCSERFSRASCNEQCERDHPTLDAAYLACKDECKLQVENACVGERSVYPSTFIEGTSISGVYQVDVRTLEHDDSRQPSAIPASELTHQSMAELILGYLEPASTLLQPESITLLREALDSYAQVDSEVTRFVATRPVGQSGSYNWGVSGALMSDEQVDGCFHSFYKRIGRRNQSDRSPWAWSELEDEIADPLAWWDGKQQHRLADIMPRATLECAGFATCSGDSSFDPVTQSTPSDLYFYMTAVKHDESHVQDRASWDTSPVVTNFAERATNVSMTLLAGSKVSGLRNRDQHQFEERYTPPQNNGGGGGCDGGDYAGPEAAGFPSNLYGKYVCSNGPCEQDWGFRLEPNESYAYSDGYIGFRGPVCGDCCPEGLPESEKQPFQWRVRVDDDCQVKDVNWTSPVNGYMPDYTIELEVTWGAPTCSLGIPEGEVRSMFLFPADKNSGIDKTQIYFGSSFILQ